MRHADQTLIFDADDTLWENNVLFESIIDDYIAWLAHPTLDPVAVRAILDEIEEANIAAHGYGSRIFLQSLADGFRRLTERPVGPSEQARLDRFAARFTSGEVELIPDVADILTELGERHALYLMTKGDPDEQQRKIDASGLAAHFRGVDIVPVKVPETYRTVVAERGLDPHRTWMIGNSPRSDIQAPREAGLRAVFIPNVHTWAHELIELDPQDDGILHLDRFAALTTHF